MKNTHLIYLSLAIATLTLTVGFFLAGILLGIPFIGFIAGLWALGETRQWRGTRSIGLTLFIIIVSIGLLLNMPPVTAVVTITAALLSWDISHFNRHLLSMNRIENKDYIEKQYRQRLLLITLSGLIIATIATSLRLAYGFGIALLLGFIAIIAFSRAISFLRRESD